MTEGVAACAALVQRGDPARFRAVMAAPVGQRAMLFPLYAFNLEVARAPWVTQEAMIAEMRLQWWRDALEEIAAGGPVRRHEVVTPLAEVLDAQGARDLDDLIEARRADIDGLRPGDEGALLNYIDRTSGTLLWTAARLAGAREESAIRAAGRAQGIAAWLLAGPDLVARNRAPLPPGEPEAVIASLARTGLRALEGAGRAERAARGVLLVMTDVRAVLRAFRDDPGGMPQVETFASRLRLGWAGLRAGG